MSKHKKPWWVKGYKPKFKAGMIRDKEHWAVFQTDGKCQTLVAEVCYYSSESTDERMAKLIANALNDYIKKVDYVLGKGFKLKP